MFQVVAVLHMRVAALTVKDGGNLMPVGRDGGCVAIPLTCDDGGVALVTIHTDDVWVGRFFDSTSFICLRVGYLLIVPQVFLRCSHCLNRSRPLVIIVKVKVVVLVRGAVIVHDAVYSATVLSPHIGDMRFTVTRLALGVCHHLSVPQIRFRLAPVRWHRAAPSCRRGVLVRTHAILLRKV